MGIFTLLALIFLVVCILAGKAALPGNPVLLVRTYVSKPLVQLLDGQSMLVLTTGTLKILLMYL